MLGKEGVTALNYPELTRVILVLRAVREVLIRVIFDGFQLAEGCLSNRNQVLTWEFSSGVNYWATSTLKY